MRPAARRLRRRPAATATAPASGAPSPQLATRSDDARRRRAVAVRRSASAARPAPTACAGCRCPAALAHRLWARRGSAARRPLAPRRRRRPRHQLRRAAEPAAAGGVGVRLLVPRPPRRRRRRRSRRAGEVLRRAAASGAIGPRVEHGRPPTRARAARHRAGRGRPPRPARRCRRRRPADAARWPDARRPAVRARRRHARAAQEPARRSSRRSALAAELDDAALVLAGAAGRRRRAPSTPPSTPLAPASRDGASCTGPVDERDEGVAAAPRRGRSPTRRSTRASASRCSRRCSVGLPIVATRAGSIPEVAGDGAELVDPSAIPTRSPPRSSRVVDDDDRRARARSPPAARNLARFSWAATAAALADALPPAARGEHAVTVAVLVPAVSARPASCAASSRSSTRPTSTAIVNTGDDTVLHGLSISPDLDTITYTLAGAIDPERGWGLAGRDVAGDGRARALRRRAPGRLDRRRRRGSTSATGPGDAPLPHGPARRGRHARPTSTDEMRRAWGVAVRLLPMTDAPVATMVELASGEEVVVPGLLRAPAPRRGRARRALRRRERAPSRRPRCSTALAARRPRRHRPVEPDRVDRPDPRPAGVDDAARRRAASASSPSRRSSAASALKGPADRMLAELGHEPSVVGVARLYAPIAGDAGHRPGRRRTSPPAVEAAGHAGRSSCRR